MLVFRRVDLAKVKTRVMAENGLSHASSFDLADHWPPLAK